jgi:hypothetical protein
MLLELFRKEELRSIPASVRPATGDFYRDEGRRAYLNWHRGTCIDVSSKYAQHLVTSAKTLQDVVNQTRAQSDERKRQVEIYKSAIRGNIEDIRENTAAMRQSSDQSKRIQGNWELALYTSAVTYSLEHSGIPSIANAQDILFTECMDIQ